MHDANSRIRALILAYEDLDAEDRRKADAFLAENPDLQRKLARMQQLEELARDPVPLEEEGADLGRDLSVEDEAQLVASMQELRKRLGLAADEGADPASPSPAGLDAPRHRIPRRDLRRSWVPLAAAAAMLLLVWAPWSTRDTICFRDLAVIEVETGSGTSRGTDDARTWSSGEAFAFTFQLKESAGVIVYHVDPLGRAALVVPGSTEEAIPYLEAGSTHRIPSAMGDEEWVLGGETGTESFLLAASGDQDLDLELLVQEIHERLVGLDDRNLVLESVRTLLEEKLDSVQLIEFEHIP